MRVMYHGDDGRIIVEDVVLATVDEKDGKYVLALLAQDDSEYSVDVGGAGYAEICLDTLLREGYLDLRDYTVEYFESKDRPYYTFGEQDD